MRKARGLLCEFVGGKVRPGETKEQTLIREYHEELAIAISVDRVFIKVDREYPDLGVHLTLFRIAICEGVPQMLEHTTSAGLHRGKFHNMNSVRQMR